MSILFSLKLLLFDITSATFQIASHTHSISCHCLINFLCRAVIFSSFCTFRSAYQLLQPSMLIRPLLGQSTETEHWHLYQSPSYLYMPWVSLKHRYWPSHYSTWSLYLMHLCSTSVLMAAALFFHVFLFLTALFGRSMDLPWNNECDFPFLSHFLP